MKHLKILGLAAVGAAALMALAGASTASADELCTEPAVSNMCPAGKQITSVEASSIASLTLKTTGGTALVTCSGASLHTKSINQGTGVSPITATGGTPEVSGCNTTLDTLNSGTTRAEAGAGGGTTLTSIGGEVTLQLFGVSCTYGSGSGTDFGEANTSGELPTFNRTVNKTAGGGLCPSTALLEAGFKMTNHNAIHYITN